MRKRLAAAAALVGLGVGVLGAAPVGADPGNTNERKVVNQLIHMLCSSPEFQEAAALEFDVKANRGQCQKALREFLADIVPT